ncbi:hypothetical protein HHI36_020574 [Cryptolaemus montrouzieri]|uniref:Cytochrome c oxidase subunit 6B1 n=1 Tax=Cryptolaemus montrouzieri TaxID=559131 RepID=A0ABD2NBD6_9CUCU
MKPQCGEMSKLLRNNFFCSLIFPCTNIHFFPLGANIHSQKTTLFQIKMPEIELKTAPFDPRFPNTNQTRYCYQSYLDYHRCQKVRGENYEPCNYFLRVYRSMCPKAWVEKWDTQREEGTFAGNI